MHLGTYLGMLRTAETTLASSFHEVAHGHAPEADVHYACQRFAHQCEAHAERLGPILDRYQRQPEVQPERLHAQGLTATRRGQVGLLRDLQDLYQLANLVDITWTLVAQAAQGARDRPLLDAVSRCACETKQQLGWLDMRMKAEAPQALLVAT